MISALNRLENGTIELTVTIPWQMVSQSYQKVLSDLAKNTIIKGFRKGMAPLKKVEEKLGKSAIYEKVLQTLIPDVYVKTIKEHNLKPIINPQVSVVTLEENKDWQIKIITCELPNVELGNYKEAVKKSLATEKIWVPGKDTKKTETNEETEDKMLGKIFKTLIETTKVRLPAILIKEEVNRMMSRLIDQTSKLGLTVEQYLSSVNKTTNQLREEYRQQAQGSLKLELILAKIADEEKIEIKDAAVEEMIQVAPDEQTKKSLNTPAQKAYIRQLLRKRQVIDNLAKL